MASAYFRYIELIWRTSNSLFICLFKIMITSLYHKTEGMVVVGFPEVFKFLVVVQILTECIIGELPPFTIVNIFTLSPKVL